MSCHCQLLGWAQVWRVGLDVADWGVRVVWGFEVDALEVEQVAVSISGLSFGVEWGDGK